MIGCGGCSVASKTNDNVVVPCLVYPENGKGHRPGNMYENLHVDIKRWDYLVLSEAAWIYLTALGKERMAVPDLIQSCAE